MTKSNEKNGNGFFGAVKRVKELWFLVVVIFIIGVCWATMDMKVENNYEKIEECEKSVNRCERSVDANEKAIIRIQADVEYIKKGVDEIKERL